MNNNKKRFGVIFGATGFLGSRLAEYYSRKNVNLILIGRNKKKLLNLKKDLEKKYNNLILIMIINLTIKGLRNFENKLKKYAKFISFVFITVGDQSPIGKFNKVNFEDWEKSVFINLIATSRLVQFTIKQFLKYKVKGSIVLFSGGGGNTPRPDFSAYAVSKSGLIRLVETISQELKNTGIKINIVAPGVMPSKMLKEILSNKNKVSKIEIDKSNETLKNKNFDIDEVLELCNYLTLEDTKITGKIISSRWDNWKNFKHFQDKIQKSDIFTLRRITVKDRDLEWGKKNI